MASRSMLKLFADTDISAVLPTASTMSLAACKPVCLLQCLLKMPVIVVLSEIVPLTVSCSLPTGRAHSTM